MVWGRELYQMSRRFIPWWCTISVRVHRVSDHVFWSQRWVKNINAVTRTRQDVAIDCGEGAYYRRQSESCRRPFGRYFIPVLTNRTMGFLFIYSLESQSEHCLLLSEPVCSFSNKCRMMPNHLTGPSHVQATLPILL